MRLSRLIADYLAYRRALGNRFASEGFVLQAFCRHLGDAKLDEIAADGERTFLFNGKATPSTVARKRRVLAGLYRYAHVRVGAKLAPLPAAPAGPPSSFVPYIYSHEELRRLLDAAPAICDVRLALVEGYALRTLLLLLYGAGLRLGEALRLNDADVDVHQAVLTIRQTKFFKTRLVPIGADLVQVLTEYRRQRDQHRAVRSDAPFLCLRNGARMNAPVVERTFRRLRAAAGVQREGGPRHQPRLHDLRHAAAVHRLLRWYRSGADVQRLLPQLATYLGHKDLSGTQRYLMLTPQLLRAAGRRFERYAWENRHD